MNAYDKRPAYPEAVRSAIHASRFSIASRPVIVSRGFPLPLWEQYVRDVDGELRQGNAEFARWAHGRFARFRILDRFFSREVGGDAILIRQYLDQTGAHRIFVSRDGGASWSEAMASKVGGYIVTSDEVKAYAVRVNAEIEALNADIALMMQGNIHPDTENQFADRWKTFLKAWRDYFTHITTGPLGGWTARVASGAAYDEIAEYHTQAKKWEQGYKDLGGVRNGPGVTDPPDVPDPIPDLKLTSGTKETLDKVEGLGTKALVGLGLIAVVTYLVTRR